MSDDDIEFNSKPLNQILKAMKEKGFNAKIGILGQKDARNSNEEKGTLSNATIGAAQEFGDSKKPQRSFLRMPITEMLPKELERAGLFDEDILKEVVKTANMKPYVEKIAIAGVAVVLDAFETSGFGKWPALKPETMERKKVKQILVETQQLRDSISYEISEKS